MKQSMLIDFKPMYLAMFNKDKMLYSEYQPCKELCQFINCYWVSPVLCSLEECTCNAKQEIIVPDGCLDIIFEINRKTKDYNCFIVGTMSKPIVILPEFAQKQIYAIRFNPGGAYNFFKNDVAGFTDLTVDFKNVSKKLEKELAIIFLSDKNLSEKINYLNKFFLKYFDEWKQDVFIMNSLASIFSAKGNIKIKKLAQDQYVSERQLNRMFKQWVGLSPKEFTRIIRFQNALQNVVLSDNKNWASLAMECGYHDQAHFINEFKVLTGITPTKVNK